MTYYRLIKISNGHNFNERGFDLDPCQNIFFPFLVLIDCFSKCCFIKHKRHRSYTNYGANVSRIPVISSHMHSALFELEHTLHQRPTGIFVVVVDGVEQMGCKLSTCHTHIPCMPESPLPPPPPPPRTSRRRTPLEPHSSVHYGEVENAAALYLAGTWTVCLLVEVQKCRNWSLNRRDGGRRFRAPQFLLRHHS